LECSSRIIKNYQRLFAVIEIGFSPIAPVDVCRAPSVDPTSPGLRPPAPARERGPERASIAGHKIKYVKERWRRKSSRREPANISQFVFYFFDTICQVIGDEFFDSVGDLKPEATVEDWSKA